MVSHKLFKNSFSAADNERIEPMREPSKSSALPVAPRWYTAKEILAFINCVNTPRYFFVAMLGMP